MSQFIDWVDIPDFEGHYQVNNQGMVMSLKSNKILKTYDSSGYEKIILCKEGVKNRLFIHRYIEIHGVKPW